MDKPPYWFKRRRYGYGWVPVTWQGWITLVAFILIGVVPVFKLPTNPRQPSHAQLLAFFIVLAIDLTALLLIIRAKAPAGRWRWGKRDSDNPDEDF